MSYVIIIWDLIKAHTKAAAIIAGIIAVIIMSGVIWHKIYTSGYNSCQIEYKTAQDKQLADAQIKIKASEDKYEKLKSQVGDDKSIDAPVGSRVKSAIIGMSNHVSK